MKILVTGGTGYVGSNAVEAFVRAGHGVRLLIRDRAKLERVFAPRGLTVDDVVVGDVLDPASVAEAVEGCDAALHAAGVVGVSHAEDASRRVNVEGTEVVVGTAVAAGLDPILYTSSVATLLPTGDEMLRVDTPLADPPGGYGRSKADAEGYVRGLQAEGAPIVSFLIGAVYGPGQPELASAMESIVAASQMMVDTRGGVGVIDVRDLAQLFVAALEPGRGPRRYLAGGQFVNWEEWTDILESVFGRALPRVPVPGGVLRGAGRLLDRLREFRDVDYPLTFEGVVEMTELPPNDDSRTLEDLGVRYRPIFETLDDSTRWLIETGDLDAALAPRLAGSISSTGERWDEEVDVVVVGYGAAGASAAIEAADEGASVLVIDRWGGGGATARSGGIVYAGGGTDTQRAAGFVDTPEGMLRYLVEEEGPDADHEVLRAFCERSTEDLAWLQGLGIGIAPGFEPEKSVVPADDRVGLYYSGNEKHFRGDTDAVPRGHRIAGSGMTGRCLFEGLDRAVGHRGIDVRAGARPVRLVVDDERRVVGLDVLELPPDRPTRLLHQTLFRAGNTVGPLLRRIPHGLRVAMSHFEERRGRRWKVRARRGVVLCTGGYSYNHDFLERHAPVYRRTMPLGTVGDDGSGILLATEAGAAVRAMDRCGASRFVAPPEAFCSGVLVDSQGRRICDESLYAATLSHHIAAHGGRAWLIVDRAIRQRVRQQIRGATRLRERRLADLLRGRDNHVVFPRLFGTVNLHLNRRMAPTVEELARRCDMPAADLRATIDRYNEAARGGGPDEMDKPEELLAPIEQPPFAAVPLHLDSFLFPAPCITLGGLDVDGLTQRVRRSDGSVIEGLFAAGRCAAGVASQSYVSGLSLADCIFSGRNAGRAVADGDRAVATVDSQQPSSSA